MRRVNKKKRGQGGDLILSKRESEAVVVSKRNYNTFFEDSKEKEALVSLLGFLFPFFKREIEEAGKKARDVGELVRILSKKSPFLRCFFKRQRNVPFVVGGGEE